VAPSSAYTKPRLRGVLHQYAFVVSLIAGVMLVWRAPSGRARLAAAIYAASVSALFGVSALFHRVNWSIAARRWMGRLDHSMICLLIAGTFTPVGMLTLSGTLAGVLLAVVWSGAFLGMGVHFIWIDQAPKWLSAAVYVVLGWTGLGGVGGIVERAGWTPTALFLLGGLLYSAGAAVYTFRRPDPRPAVFGYHEVFHALVVAAASLHYAVVAIWVVPAS
jgi:hemolysin III